MTAIKDRPELKLLLVDVRSAHNVGAIWRSAEAFGVGELILTGITPYPEQLDDARLPHVRHKASQMIAKTALGGEKRVPFRYFPTAAGALRALASHHLYALEITPRAADLRYFKAKWPAVLMVGNEVDGLALALLKQAETTLRIPTRRTGDSLNVAVAASIALYSLTKPAL